MSETSSSISISTRLERIATLARQAPTMSFTTLAHHIDMAWLREAHRRTRKDGARGVDDQSADEYATKLEENLQSLLARAKTGAYVAPSVRRVHIPKGGGRYLVGEPYRVAGRTYVPRDYSHYSAKGLASWYGNAFHGRKTANGEVYDMADLTAAHPTLPLPSYVRVTNLANGRSIVVRVNDRGPYSRNRLIDVSATVAAMLDFKRKGTAQVKVAQGKPQEALSIVEEALSEDSKNNDALTLRASLQLQYGGKEKQQAAINDRPGTGRVDRCPDGHREVDRRIGVVTARGPGGTHRPAADERDQLR